MIDEPLVRALAEGEAVAFVGSGASISSDLPDWRTFLRKMLDFAKTLPGADWARTEQFWAQGDYLLAAEMLQRELPVPTFNGFVKDTFGRPGLEPNEIHLSIARLPFSLALTTNIDTLLEASYPDPATCTWRDPDAVFNAIRSRNFAVIKLHGSVSDPLSARLTRTHYRDGALTNPEFNECIRHLLTWKTILFIGYSLRDSDLLYLIDEARLRYGKKFGPHYAIMPDDEADPKFQAYLRDALSIETIPYKRNTTDPKSATAQVVRILKNLAGRVSEKRYGEYGIGLGLNDLSITRDEAVQAVLDRAAPLTGSMRADVCMIKDDIYPRLCPVAIFPRKREVRLPEAIVHDSITQSVVLQAAAKDEARDYVYIKDVSRAAEDLRAMGYSYAKYIVCDTSVRSELACPIIADGRRVGTLNFESSLIDGYTEEHIRVARRIASELGRIYLQSEQRRRTAAPIEEYEQRPERFAELMTKSRLVKTLKHDFLLYAIDYEKRILRAKHTSGKSISHSFDEKSLANRAFLRRGDVLVPDADLAVKQYPHSDHGWLRPSGVEQFNIHGPVFACPVRAAGQTEAVLVTWLKEQEGQTPLRDSDPLELFRSSSRQASRLANLLANDIFRPGSSRVESFLNSMYASLESVDGGAVWTKEKLKDSVFRGSILDALVQSVLLPECGMKRVRVWRTVNSPDDGEPAGFKIVKWLTTDEIKDQPAEKYLALDEFRADNVYSRYTVSRYRQDPFAQWQHPAMFSEADPRTADIDKDPKGSWIVAPIVKTVKGKPELHGFLSADMHMPTESGPKDRRSDDPRESAFQCTLMDLISDLAQYVLPAVQPPEPNRLARGRAAS